MNAPASKSNWGLIVLLIIAVLLVGGFLRLRIGRLPGEEVYGAQKVALNIAGSSPPLSLGNFKNGFASVIDPDLPAVVNISSTKVVKGRTSCRIFSMIRSFGNSSEISLDRLLASPKRNGNTAWVRELL